MKIFNYFITYCLRNKAKSTLLLEQFLLTGTGGNNNFSNNEIQLSLLSDLNKLTKMIARMYGITNGSVATHMGWSYENLSKRWTVVDGKSINVATRPTILIFDYVCSVAKLKKDWVSSTLEYLYTDFNESNTHEELEDKDWVMLKSMFKKNKEGK